MTLKEDIAVTLKNRRKELGLTLEELAILIWEDSSKKSQISTYENNKRVMGLDTLELFLKALQLDLKLIVKQ
ncbi:helix-turn-helix domain-containing protein [Myroides sp. LoEW2-1]|uniref:helix-turn-helix domain-containing protein n=1 Tax=Myroides sp. LoEW2-1 TaxID=2683192 RepID=UPI0013239A9C|nr:helix-turn-helix transcriptional regulator [Myroides sp. LoEW2-1]MVX36238.1 helix-turn-helix domain-containing protein [Myroides sp. LoEW2-1]